MSFDWLLHYATLFFVPAALFWRRGQNPKRHPSVPRLYTYRECQESEKCVGSMGSFLDLMKLGAHGDLG